MGGGGIVGYVRRVDTKAGDAKRKAEKNERAIFGEEDDPNVEGVAQIVHQTRDELRQFRQETKREHRQVMERLEEIEAGGDFYRGGSEADD